MAADPQRLPRRQGRPRTGPGGGCLRDRLQPRELRRRHRDCRVRAQAGSVRDGPPHFRDSRAQFRVSYHARDSDRVGEGGSDAQRARLRGGGECAQRR